MEKYKFSYGLDKTKYIVVDTSSDKPVIINENIKEGTVQQTSEYKYVGLFINEKGNLSSHLEYLRAKARGAIKEMLNISHESHVGKESVRVKLP